MKKILFTLLTLSTFLTSLNAFEPPHCTCDGEVVEGNWVMLSPLEYSRPYTDQLVITNAVCMSDGALRWFGDYKVANHSNGTSATYRRYQKRDICICNTEDISFPIKDINSTYSEQWRVDAPEANENRQICSDNNGTIENAKLTCIDFERCKIPNFVPCDQNNTDYPTKAVNQKVELEWSEPDDKSVQCTAINGTQQSRVVECKNQYRCLVKTEEPPKEEPECISSYVSPRDQTFHEDITLTGAEFGLHYSSGNIDENQSKTIAYGWHFSNHATLTGDKLYLGNGSLWVVEPVAEDNFTVVKSGSSELLFDKEGKHISTRDLYTKEVEATFAYDEEEKLISVTNRYGEITDIQRDTQGMITTIIAPNGQTTYLAIDENHDLLEVQYEDTTSYTFEYEQHLMTLEREPKGNEFLHFFDEQGKVVKVIDAEQGEWDFGTTRDSTSGTYTVTRASGDTITYKNHFLEKGILKTEKTLPTGDIILYENTVDDSLSSTTTCGQTNTNTYKVENGTLAKDPLHDRRILESNTQTTPSGLSRTTNFSTNYNFDANNTLISVANITETNGATSTSLRDYNQSTLTFISPEGRVSTTTYNQHKLPIKTQYTNLKPIKYRYDKQGRLIKTKQGSRIMKYTHDEQGYVAEAYNVQRDTKTTYIYDLLGRVTQTTYADGTTEHFSYDSNGNLITRTIPTPADHSFAYNGVNKRTSYTSPLEKQTTYTYDKQRRVTKVTKPSGKSIDTTYTDGRVTSVQTPEQTTSYAYACQNNLSAISKDDESISFIYDGTLITAMTQSGILEQTLSYTYNNDFRVASFSYANQTENYSYDLDGLLTQSGDYTLTRDAQNGLTTNITDGTLNIDQTHNAFGELKTQKSQNLKLFLTRKEGRIAKIDTKIVDHWTNSNGKAKKSTTRTIHHYTYDNRDRLIEVREGKEAENLIEQYSYDANGNRASATVHGETTTASYTLDDQLVVYGDNTYRYDEDGYLEEKVTPQGTTTYSYGTLGELKEVNTPTQNITYQHNANNQRVAKVVDGTTVEKYLWANLTTLLAVYDGDDNLKERFEYADNRMPLSMTDSNNTKYYLHYDQVGTIRAISDIDHNIIKEVTYDTFGTLLTDSNPSFTVPFGFAGGLYDKDTKLTRFGHRDYDAYTGKWTAKDPIGFDGGDSNLYGYVLGDPVNFIDPDGLKKGFNNPAICIAVAAGRTNKSITNCNKIIYDAYNDIANMNDDYFKMCNAQPTGCCIGCLGKEFYEKLKDECTPDVTDLKKPQRKKK